MNSMKIRSKSTFEKVHGVRAKLSQTKELKPRLTGLLWFVSVVWVKSTKFNKT